MKTNIKNLLAASIISTALLGCSSGKPTVTLKGSDGGTSPSTTLTHGLTTGTIDASSLKLKVYKFAVSASEDCSSPITIFTSAAGEEKDIATGPSFGSGPLDPGTYPCVMIEMSKVIKTTASTTSGFCTAGVEFSDVICNDSGQESQLIDGTSVTCSGGAAHDQKVVVYITTLRSGSGGDRALLPPTSSSDNASGVILTSAFHVDGDVTGTLTVDLHNFLGSDGVTCGTNPPPFSFE